MDAALVKFEHPLAKYRSTLSVDILGRSTCRPTLSWLTVKMSPDMLVNMLANMSTEGQWTYQSIGHPHSANTLMILGWLFFWSYISCMCPQIFVVSIDMYKALICLMWKNCLLNFFFKHSSACHACCTLTWLKRHRVREDMNSDLWSDFLSGWLCWTFSDLLSVLTF